VTPVPARRLDWKGQFAALRPYFEGRGGVVHVHASKASPVSTFARVVRHQLAADKWPFKWSTVQIDPSNNASTHYVPDIIAQIRRSARLGDVTGTSQRPINVSVGNEIDAGGNVVLSNIDIDVGPDEYGQSTLESERISAFCALLKAALETRRVALIFVDTHKSKRESLTSLGRKLWEGALADLTPSGLLVIDIFNPASLARRTYAWPPDPDLTLQLPVRYDDKSRADALDDLASMALDESWFLTYEEARAFAVTVLATSDDIRDVYAQLAKAVAGLGTDVHVQG
jgi:hypothetical protein